MAKSIMIQGTASGVGKTILTLALCRIFKQDGYRVAPFKSQNMTANTAVIENGEEIAISQLLQSNAAGALPDARMNPVVLKPLNNGHGTQVMLMGREHCKIVDKSYRDLRADIFEEVKSAYASLCEENDIIVIEGAGSPVELNLNDGEIVNMSIARFADAPVLLVSDIDRGGIFASLYGTINLLSESERRHVKATIVNRFKGDLSLFSDGRRILEEITGVPVAGVVPYFEIDLPEEDSVYKTDEPSPCLPTATMFDDRFDLIAGHVRGTLDMELVYRVLDEGV